MKKITFILFLCFANYAFSQADKSLGRILKKQIKFAVKLSKIDLIVKGPYYIDGDNLPVCFPELRFDKIELENDKEDAVPFFVFMLSKDGSCKLGSEPRIFLQFSKNGLLNYIDQPLPCTEDVKYFYNFLPKPKTLLFECSE